MADKTSPFYARLKRYDPKRDNAMRVYVVGTRRFDEGKWLPVDATWAEELRKVHQSFYDEESPLAFDIISADEAKAQGVIAQNPEVSTASSVTSSEGPDKPARGKKAKEG